MMKRVGLLLMMCWISGSPAAWAVEWAAVAGIEESVLSGVAVDPADARVLLVSSERRLYRSGDAGGRWKKVASVRGADGFRQIVYHGISRGRVLAVSQKTLYTSVDTGLTWKRWRKPFGEVRMISAAYADERGDVVYVGTDEGLFRLDLRDGTAGPVAGFPRVSVLGIGARAGGSYAAVTPRGIYGSDEKGWQLEKPLGASSAEPGEGDALGQFDIEEMAITPVNAFVLHRPLNSLTMVPAAHGILTQGPGQAWTPLDGSTALRGVRAAEIAQDGGVYLAGKDGVYRLEEASGLLRDASTGLAGAGVSDMDYHAVSDTLYAATDRGLYRARYVSVPAQVLPQPADESAPKVDAELVPAPAQPLPLSSGPVAAPMTEQEVLKRYAHEPSVTAVQERAIRYAEVHPDKIAAWRRAAARRAWLPSVSVGWDHDTTQSVDLDRGGTGDPDQFIIGPEESGMDWSVNVGWHLGDLLWNDDQTSIDTRSKLMVELRDDILNEVTHAYFERRRLQVETVLSPGRELGTRLERELRIQELTARIDALTGGWFSGVIGSAHKEVPDHGESYPGA